MLWFGMPFHAMQVPQECNFLGGSGLFHRAKFDLFAKSMFVSVRNLVRKVLCTVVHIILIYAVSSVDMSMIKFISD